MCISLARRSVSLPLPSSPHWVPTTTVAGTRHSSVAKSGLRASVARTPPADPRDGQVTARAVRLRHRRLSWSPDWSSPGPWLLFRAWSGQHDGAVDGVHGDGRALGVPALEEGQRQRVLDLSLDDPAQGS